MVYTCLDHKEDLLATFGGDVCVDTPDVHPQNFCNSCYSACKRRSRAASKSVPYHHSIDIFCWEEHKESACMVSSTVAQ